ncbi:MAG: beta-galactosidase small subunit, partial [Rikenellaceae bacterium]
NGDVVIRTVYTLKEQEAEVAVTYTIDAKGAINVAYSLDIQNRNVAEILRVGMNMVLKGEYENMTWLGRGPHESYADRKLSADVDLYKATVWEQFHPYVRPQETGNKTDVRWSSLQNKEGNGLMVVAGDLLNVSAWNFPMDDIMYVPSTIERKHGKAIKKKDMVWFNIDYKQQGVGGDNTWGAPVHTPYQISPVDMSYSFTIMPITKGDDLVAKSKIKLF